MGSIWGKTARGYWMRGWFLYPVPFATLSSLGGRIRRPCPRARRPAARARKLAGQHPFLWVWPCLFLEAQSRLWGFGNRGRDHAWPELLQPAFHASNVSAAMSLVAAMIV